MEFKILDADLENTLQEIIKDKKVAFNDEFCLPINKYKKTSLESLIEKGFLKIGQNGKKMKFNTFVLTHEGENYFKLKEKYLSQENRKKRKDNLRYWITTSISIIAIIVSIVAIIVSVKN